ncbi:hypothetical protein LCGC14_0362550 [marine sediment metagenome]|uniref:Uncharacterized protein n=1 Tax=marine sediment metagenome TaxID=412755 RepID=A0A0F9TQT4_9ZZZZ
MAVSAEMPKYVCHKEVYALKIKSIDHDDAVSGGPNKATITPEDERYDPFEVDAAYMEKHKPAIGGYYVVYKDGYKSFSPAEAFEGGYTLVV